VRTHVVAEFRRGVEDRGRFVCTVRRLCGRYENTQRGAGLLSRDFARLEVSGNPYLFPPTGEPADNGRVLRQGDWRVHCVNEAVNERPPAGLLEFAEPFQSIAYGDRIHSHAGDGEILNRPEDGLVRRPVEILSPEALGIPGPPWCRQEEAAQDGDLGVVVEGERYPYLRGHGPYSSS